MFLFSQLVSSVLQILVFGFVPFIVYLIKFKTNKKFLKYIGLNEVEAEKTIKYAIFGFVIIFITMTGPSILLLRNGVFNASSTVQGQLKSQGLNVESIIMLLLYAILKTSLSEEILFRGFIGKRLIHKFGFAIGNTIQAILFGLIHTVIPSIGVENMISIFIFTSLNGYLSGYLVEKKSGGSIVPSWIVHAAVNCIAFFLFAYVF